MHIYIHQFACGCVAVAKVSPGNFSIAWRGRRRLADPVEFVMWRLEIVADFVPPELLAGMDWVAMLLSEWRWHLAEA